jgi:hypothetical protein
VADSCGRGKPRPYSVLHERRAGGRALIPKNASGWRSPVVFRVWVLGFDRPVLCPRNRLHVAGSRGRGKPRPYQMLHDEKAGYPRSPHQCEAIRTNGSGEQREYLSAGGRGLIPGNAFGCCNPAVFRVRVWGFDRPVLCPRDRLHVAESSGRGKPRPYQVFTRHERGGYPRSTASMGGNRNERKWRVTSQGNRRVVLHSVLRRVFHNDASCSKVSEKPGGASPAPTTRNTTWSAPGIGRRSGRKQAPARPFRCQAFTLICSGPRDAGKAGGASPAPTRRTVFMG